MNNIFFREMFLHMSLLFAPKEAATPEKLAVHIRLCRAVLTVYLTLAHKLGPSLAETTWEAWLKTLMAVVDCIYQRGPKDQLHIELFPVANQVLHEAWLLSHTTNSTLWTSFGDLARTWLNSSAVLQWCATSFGLTRAQLYRLYGPEWGTPNVSLEVALDEKTTAKTMIELDTETIYYFWYRMINIIGNLHTTLREPELYRLAYNGLNKIVDAYLEACKNPPPNKTPPSGNTLIQLLGKWLFDAVLEDRPGFEEGTSLAASSLCKIFCFSLDRRFSPTYLSLFCFSLNKILQKDISDKVLISVLVNTRQLFTQQLEGINVLIPAFLYAFSRVWTKTGPEANVRGACIDIMSTIIGMSTHYKEIKLCSLSLLYEITYPKEEGNTLPPPPHDVLTYSQVDAHLRMLLLRGLSFEESSRNLQKILWCIQILVVDLTLKQTISYGRLISPEDEKFIKYVVTRILNSITSGTWSADVIQTSYQVLSCLTPVYPCLDEKNKLARLIIETLSNHVIKSVDNRVTCVTQAQREDNERIIIGAYQSIADWLVTTDWPKKKGVPKKLAELLAKTITAGLTVSKDPSPLKNTPTDPVEVDSPRKLTSSDKIKDAAECVLTVLTRVMGSYPSYVGPQNMSSVISEEDIYKQITQEYAKKQTSKVSAKQFNRIFLLDDSIILSAFDLPSASGDEAKVVLIVRDKSGRYSWTAELKYFDKFRPKNKIATPGPTANNPNNPPGSPTPLDPAENMVTSTGTEPAELTDAGFDDCVDAGDPVIPVEDDSIHVLPIDLQSKMVRGDFTEILNFIEKKRGEHKLSEQIMNETAVQVESEREYLKKNQYGMNHHITFQVPKKRDIYAGDCKFQHARIFLNHLGLLSPSNVGRLSVLDVNNASFMADLKMLDQVSERDSLQIGVVYVSKGQTTAETVYANTSATRDYADFLASLGWLVDLSKHTGFKGEFATEPVASQPNFSNKAIYYANYSTELLFAVSTLLSTDPNIKPKEGESWTEVNNEVRKRIISHSNVMVVWIDDFDDYRPKPLQTIGVPSLIRSHTPPPTQKEVLTPKEVRISAVVEGTSPPPTRGEVSSSSEDKVRSPLVKKAADGIETTKKISLSDDKLTDRRRKHGSIGRGTPTKIVATTKTVTPIITRSAANQTGVHIIIQPLQSGLYRLRTLRDGRPVMIGPILDNMIVGKHLLADLVRRTAIFANKLIRSKPDNPWISPLAARQIALHQLASKYKREMTLEEFYTSLFIKNGTGLRATRSQSRVKESTLKSKSELEMLQNTDDNVFSDDEDMPSSPRTKKEKKERREKEKKEKEKK
eukprot:TRINITY_DN1236_c0_g1_i1.p1 TRINITY_DN1236_c0_g1~~TRINITY_DN1236_c0_g1_i1.p1  ORF type:complete len:1308 (-),score=371.16 TRINITY_DN1236_c0_g1_i1:111-4034(-)